MSARTKATRCSRLWALTILAVLSWAPPSAEAEIQGRPAQRLQDSFDSGLEGFAFDLDQMGGALAVGDFNGDGRDDLAVSDRESLTAEDEGAVHVIYGSPTGLSTAGDQLFKDYDPATGLSDREIGDAFGDALAAADFNGDGFADLAIGVPLEDVVSGGLKADVGALLVLYGSPSGLLQQIGAQRFTKGLGVLSAFLAEAGDRWGRALAAGDFNADGRADLAIGCDQCDFSTVQEPADAGAVFVLLGTPSGLVVAGSGVGSLYFDQGSSFGGFAMLDDNEVGDRFGTALAAGDFDGDAVDDLAIGVPGESFGSAATAGAVQVLYGVAGQGLRLEGNQHWHEANTVTGGVEEAGDRFGAALAAGDVTGEGIDDLVIGAPNEDIDGHPDAGAVTLLWGQPGSGLGSAGSEIYTQTSLGDGETPGDFENFGSSLAIGDFVDRRDGGRADLAIGIPQEEVFDPFTFLSYLRAGSVSIVPGGFGLDPAGSQIWAQGFRNSPGFEDLANDAHYAFSLAAGDFDGNGHRDLAIGALGVDGATSAIELGTDAGAVYVLYGIGLPFADGFEGGDSARWTESTQTTPF